MKNRIWIAFALLVLLSLACSLGGGGNGGEATGEPQTGGGGGSEVQPTAAPVGGGEEPGAPQLDPDALNQLTSYRGRMITRTTLTDGTTQTSEILIEETRDPLAQRYVITAEGGETEMVHIGDTTWLCSAGFCMQSQQSAEEFASDFGEGLFNAPEDLASIAGDSDYDYVGKETVNGIRTRHYVLNLTPAEAAALMGGEVTDFHFEIWVADEANLPAFSVRMVMRWTGTSGDQQGTFEYEYEILEVNTPFTIEPPEGAGSGFPADVPQYPTATDLAMMGTMITFSTTDSVETVASFYRDALAAQGWTLGSEEQMGMVLQSWSKGGRNLSLMISSDGSGNTSVLITLEE
jgi:outer membrane lipoprotein-sorting protein